MDNKTRKEQNPKNAGARGSTDPGAYICISESGNENFYTVGVHKSLVKHLYRNFRCGSHEYKTRRACTCQVSSWNMHLIHLIVKHLCSNLRNSTAFVQQFTKWKKNLCRNLRCRSTKPAVCARGRSTWSIF